MSVKLSETIAAVKSGAIFNDLTGQLSDVTDMASKLPPDLKEKFDTASAGVLAQMKEAQANFRTTSAIASQHADIINQRVFAEEGRSATEEELEEACAPLSIFEKGPALLKELIGNIYDGIGGFAKELGASISGFVSDAQGLAKSAASKFTEISSKVAGFVSDIATAVTEEARALAQAAYDAFKSANSAIMDAVDKMTAKINEVAGELTSKVTALVDTAKAALGNAVGAIKDWISSIDFSIGGGSPCAKNAKEIAIDTSKLANPADLAKAAMAGPAGVVSGAVSAATGAVGAATSAINTATGAIGSFA